MRVAKIICIISELHKFKIFKGTLSYDRMCTQCRSYNLTSSLFESHSSLTESSKNVCPPSRFIIVCCPACLWFVRSTIPHLHGDLLRSQRYWHKCAKVCPWSSPDPKFVKPEKKPNKNSLVIMTLTFSSTYYSDIAYYLFLT